MDLESMIQAIPQSENPQQAFHLFLHALHERLHENDWKVMQMLWEELKASQAKITDLEFVNAGLEAHNEYLELQLGTGCAGRFGRSQE